MAGSVESLGRHHADGRLDTDLPPLTPPAPPPRPAVSQPLWPRRPRPGRALQRSLLWYGLLSVVLLVVWAMSGRDYFWPIWPILGFALFLGWQAFNLLGPQTPDQRRRRDPDP